MVAMSGSVHLTGTEAAQGAELAPISVGNASGSAVEHRAGDRTRRNVLVTSMVAGALALLLVWQYAGMGIARRAGLVPRQQHFTAVYFKYPARLPGAASVGRQIELVFVVDNREGAERRYRWRIILTARARSIQLAAGAVDVAAGRARQLTVAFDVPPVVGSAKVQVDVGSPPVGIDFHLRIVAPRTVSRSRVRTYPAGLD
ncbi:MAG: hypothetical protein M0Z95_23545 [Actinomycetota bacterium]|nr:hypothetical protein [Actinomycetota bacterium]